MLLELSLDNVDGRDSAIMREGLSQLVIVWVSSQHKRDNKSVREQSGGGCT